MSEKLILVKYELEDGTPVDESSLNLDAAYIPPEFKDWMEENKFVSEMLIKETFASRADIPVVMFTEFNDNGEYQLGLALCFAFYNMGHLACQKDPKPDISAIKPWEDIIRVLRLKQDNYAKDNSVLLIVG
jgi:hypothetical protein